MTTFAYPEIYKEIAADNLGVMFDYGVNCCHINEDVLLDLFIESGCANQFENGSPRVLVGMSGVELCRNVLQKTKDDGQNIEYASSVYRSPEYWGGWILSQYQWYSCQTFSDIHSCVKMKDLLELYYPLHEAHEFKTFKTLDKMLLAGGYSLYNSINQKDEIVVMRPYFSTIDTFRHFDNQRER